MFIKFYPIVKQINFLNICKSFSFTASTSATSPPQGNPAKVLYKHLMRQTEKLPKGAKQYYKFMIKQSYKQYINETDPERINQIIKRSYDDCDWVLKKYSNTKN